MSREARSYYVGLDLGGTTIGAGLTDEHGALLASASCRVAQDKGVDAVVNQLAEMAKRVARDAHMGLSDVTAIGIGSPGLLDPKSGVIAQARDADYPPISPPVQLAGRDEQ